MEKQWKQRQTSFSWAPKSLQIVTAAVKLKDACSLEAKLAMTNLDSILKQRHYFADKGPFSQNYGFSSSHVWMWELNNEKCWALNNWCLQTVVLEKTPESPLDSEEIKPVNPKENESWIFIGKTDTEAETPILWPPHAKRQVIGKDPDAGKDWRQEKKGTSEDEMVEWHHKLNRHEFEQAPGDVWRTGKPGMLHSLGWQRVGHNWATEQQQQQYLEKH